MSLNAAKQAFDCVEFKRKAQADGRATKANVPMLAKTGDSSVEWSILSQMYARLLSDPMCARNLQSAICNLKSR